MLFIIIFENIIKLKDRSVILNCLKLQYLCTGIQQETKYGLMRLRLPVGVARVD